MFACPFANSLASITLQITEATLRVVGVRRNFLGGHNQDTHGRGNTPFDIEEIKNKELI